MYVYESCTQRLARGTQRVDIIIFNVTAADDDTFTKRAKGLCPNITPENKINPTYGTAT